MSQQTAPTQPSTATDPQRLEKLYMENTLLRVAGVMFCHDPKKARTRVNQITIKKDLKEKTLTVAPHPHFGQPGTLAHKIFVAVIKKHSDYGRPAPQEVSFGKREIMRMMGRATWGGKDSAELTRALYEIRNTAIIAFFESENKKFYEVNFSLFNSVLFERRNSQNDPIEGITIEIAKPIITSLRDKHFTCLNFFLLQRLSTIGQAVYMRLFFHF